MAQISRLKDAEISNGNLIDADDIDAELNQLVSAHNTNDTLLTSVATGTYSFSGVKTFSSTPKMNAIDERTAGSGVTIDGLLIKDAGITFTDAGELTIATGAITVTGSYHTVDTESDAASDDLDTINGGAAGRFLILQAENDARTVVVKHDTGNILLANGLSVSLDDANKALVLVYSAALSKWVEAGRGAPLPPGYISSTPWVRASNTEITIPAGVAARDFTNAADIVVASDLTVDITDSGANGLDTGTASSATATPYFVWLIKNPTTGTVAGLLSASASAPTLPSGYTLKKRLPGWIVRNASDAFIAFQWGAGYPYRPTLRYDVPMTVGGGTNGATIVVDGVAASTTYASADCSVFAPESVAKRVILNVVRDSGNHFVTIRNGNGTGEEFSIPPANASSGSSASGSGPIEIGLDPADGTIDYKASAASGNFSIDVMGGIDTEVSAA